MAAQIYDEALRRLLEHEGGYTNHPSDPGGPTNFGITIGDYRRYVKPDAVAADVRTMRIEDAKAIYRARYWNAMRCDELPAGLDYAVFDYGVNSGLNRASKVLQRLVGFADTGRIDDALLAAIRKRDARDLVRRLCDERLAFLKRLKTWPVFGAGWSRRVSEVRAAALAMAAGARTVAGKPVPSPGKAVTTVSTAWRKRLAGLVVAAGAALATQATQFKTESTMDTFILILTAAFAGYLVSVFTWPRVR